MSRVPSINGTTASNLIFGNPTLLGQSTLAAFKQAWTALQEAMAELREVPSYRFDLVDVAREVLAAHFHTGKSHVCRDGWVYASYDALESLWRMVQNI